MEPTFFENQNQFRSWLADNYMKESELIVGFYKVGSKRPSMNWSESVDQALCFGWIDGVRKSIDDHSYTIRFTPRRKTSIWSAINIKKIETLSAAGLMTEAGLLAFNNRTEARSNVYSHENKDYFLDSQFEKEFMEHNAAWEFFIRQSPSYRKVIIHWIMTAKREATRRLRLKKVIETSAQQRKIT